MSRVVLVNLISCTRGTCSYSDVPYVFRTFDVRLYKYVYSSCGTLASGSFDVYVLRHAFDVHKAKLFFSFCDTFRYIFFCGTSDFPPCGCSLLVWFLGDGMSGAYPQDHSLSPIIHSLVFLIFHLSTGKCASLMCHYGWSLCICAFSHRSVCVFIYILSALW